MAVVRGYVAPDVARTVVLPHGLSEIIVAAILIVAILVAWKRVEPGRGVCRVRILVPGTGYPDPWRWASVDQLPGVQIRTRPTMRGGVLQWR